LSLAILLLPSLAQAGPRYSASSQLSASGGDHSAELIFDGLLDTSWAEGAPGLGMEQWIEVDLGRDVAIEKLSIWPGAFSGKEHWSARGRLAEATLTLTGPDGTKTKAVSFGDRYARKDVRIGMKVRSFRVTIDEVHEGSVFAETHVAEIAIDLKADPDPAWQASIDRAISRSRSLRSQKEKEQETLDAAYQGCREDQDYSSNFKLIGSTLAHGPDYRVALVQRYVPAGYRLPFLQFSETAADHMGRLKNANAIPYFEIAAAGALKKNDREWLFDSVKYFRAYQELLRTGRSTVPNWGSTGMELGAFRSLGEPLSIAVDSKGNVWVTDVGNNRVQRLSPNGTADLVIGQGDKAIAETWFGDRADPYASAVKPGKEAGQFMQPLHLSVGNYDILAVVDADLRMQTFDEEGKPKAQWQIDSSWRPSPGTGSGAPLVTWLDDDFYVLIQDEVLIYSAEGELKKRFNLEGGVVQCAVIAAGGRLLVRHVGSREIIEYTPTDGFRQGRWTKKGVPEDGSEDWDMATDEKDNVYVVTDAGKVYKWNKRGRFQTEFVAFENPRDMPRIAVFGAVVYVSGKDEIARIVQDE